NSILVTLLDGNGTVQSLSFDTFSGLTNVSLDFDQQFNSIDLFDVRSLQFSVDSVADAGAGYEVFTLRGITYLKDESRPVPEPGTASLLLIAAASCMLGQRKKQA
ncbi:MAG: PEP-CTERM sorting domain-containing protein, partial [Rhodocyclaceae bacterium]|nr:PEP-CTERM sorting domain-containing protein [Rhodocyclaceae bacterium]